MNTVVVAGAERVLPLHISTARTTRSHGGGESVLLLKGKQLILFCQHRW
jgi:hypothetical protein